MMTAGQWVLLTADTLAVDAKGRLVDGHHRLHAVIEYNQPVEMYVTHNVSGEINDLLSTCAERPRSFANWLQVFGETNTYSLAAVVTLVWRHEILGMTESTAIGSNVKLWNLLQAHKKGIIAASTEARRLDKLRDRRIVPASIVGFLLYECGKKHPDLAADFFTGLYTGQEIKAGSPLLALRRSLGNLYEQEDHPDRIKVMALCIKGWNATLRGETPSLIRWNPGEEFPDIEGAPRAVVAK